MERLGRRVDHDERDAAAPELLAHRLADVREHRDHAGRASRERALDPALARPPPALHLGEHDGQLVATRDALDSAHDLERPFALELVEDELEERRTTSRAARSLVAVLADHGLHPATRGGRDVSPAVDHL